MRSTLIKPLTAIALMALLTIQVNSQTENQKSGTGKAALSDSGFFNALVTQYVESINQADTVLGRKLWAPTAEISFIHPRGTEYGWAGIRTIYNMFRENFSARRLTFYDLKYSYYGDVSWVTFYWIFDATVKPGNNALRTKGRETQIWRKINYEWRLVHVHYSGMPVTGQGEAF